MSGRPVLALVLLALLVTLSPSLALAQAPTKASAILGDPVVEARALAERIDQLIEARLAAAGVKPAPPASPSQFFRRLNLDLNGRIPTLTDARDYFDDDRPDKRSIWVERVLANKDMADKSLYARHFANVLRAQMLNGNSANPQVIGLMPGFEAWLQQRLEANMPYNKLVRELLGGQGGNQAFNFNGGASPAAFYIDNENKAENLASATSRIFLGVKLECAQCHPHPFAKWTRNQFWEYAAFFRNYAAQNPFRGQGGNQPVNLNKLEIKIPGTDKVVQGKFLDGKVPDYKPGSDARVLLVDWMTAADNPFFARAAVDHVWSYFFGISLMTPIVEPSDDGLPTHPELLDLLAREFREHNYDITFLVRSLVNTRAYHRSSETTSPDKEDIYLFARMPVRGMSPEQLYDSFAEATAQPETSTTQDPRFNGFNQQSTPRREFIAKFTGMDKRLEAHTSILQALFMMNNKTMTERTRLSNNRALETIAKTQKKPSELIDTMYYMVLSRLPRAEERERMVRYFESGGPTHDRGVALADIYWVLLNSGEFALNH